jgi:hypothetical protein
MELRDMLLVTIKSTNNHRSKKPKQQRWQSNEWTLERLNEIVYKHS